MVADLRRIEEGVEQFDSNEAITIPPPLDEAMPVRALVIKKANQVATRHRGTRFRQGRQPTAAGFPEPSRLPGGNTGGITAGPAQ